MLSPESIAPERLRPLRRVEYDKLVDLGVFDEDERVELLMGALVRMSPQSALHAEVIARLTAWLVPALQERAVVRVQLPFAASEDSEPEPDIAVVPHQPYSGEHPREALLVVEVAGDSRRKDRGVKAELYAAAQVPEYWVIDLDRRQVEVRTQPAPGGYGSLTVVTGPELLQPKAFPGLQTFLKNLLP